MNAHWRFYRITRENEIDLPWFRVEKWTAFVLLIGWKSYNFIFRLKLVWRYLQILFAVHRSLKWTFAESKPGIEPCASDLKSIDLRIALFLDGRHGVNIGHRSVVVRRHIEGGIVGCRQPRVTVGLRHPLPHILVVVRPHVLPLIYKNCFKLL